MKTYSKFCTIKHTAQFLGNTESVLVLRLYKPDLQFLECLTPILVLLYFLHFIFISIFKANAVHERFLRAHLGFA